MTTTSTQCNICGSEAGFIKQELDREGWLCKNCSASSRHRVVIYALGLCLETMHLPLVSWQARRQLRILESSGRGSYPMMLNDKFEYYNTEYDPTSELIKQPFTRIADFQQLAYDENQLDVVIASDVFEHVREDDKAYPEIYRVLKPNGVFILTVPYNHDWEQTLVRVKVEGDKDIFLLPPEYHGGGGQTLAYRTYGRDLLARLRAFGFSVGYFDLEIPLHGITRQEMFVCVKSPFIDMTPFHRSLNSSVSFKKISASPLVLFRLFLLIKYNLLSTRHFLAEIVRKLTDAFSHKCQMPNDK